MKLRLLLSISLALLAVPMAHAQSADDFFHSGAQSYLTNNVQNALTQTEAGLKLYPDDTKLKKLYELLKKQQQQQSQQNQQQQNQQNQQQQQQQNQSKSSQDQQRQNQQQQNQQEAQNKQQQQQQGQQKPNKPDEQKPEEQQTAPGQMTPEQAKKLLDAQKNDEALMPVSRSEKPKNQERAFKDW